MAEITTEFAALESESIYILREAVAEFPSGCIRLRW